MSGLPAGSSYLAAVTPPVVTPQPLQLFLVLPLHFQRLHGSSENLPSIHISAPPVVGNETGTWNQASYCYDSLISGYFYPSLL